MIVQYKIIVDTQDRSHPTKNKKTYLLNIDELLTDGTDSDKLVITKDNDYVLRYFKASEFNVMSKLDTPYKEPIDININLFEGTNFVYIENITGEDIYAEYIIKNDFTDVYVTKNTMNSTISESIDKIELSISQKLTDYSKTNDMDDAINTAVKKAKDDINSTTDNKLKDYATTKEMNAAIKLSTDGIEQKVSEKLITYSTTDEMNNAIGIAKNDVNSETDNKLKSYPIVEEVNSAIEQKADSIRLSVSKTLKNYSTTKEMNSALELKIDKDDNDQIISMINASADRITLSAGRLVINSGNFKLDENGNVKCTNGEFQGNITLKKGNDISIQADNNMKCMSLDYSGLAFYDYNNNVVDSITRTNVSNKFFGTSVLINDNSYFAIENDIGNTRYKLINFYDKDSTPFIRNTANGTIFSKNSAGGVKIKNGLITDFNINSISCDVNNVTITGIKISNGLIEDITYHSN